MSVIKVGDIITKESVFDPSWETIRIVWMYRSIDNTNPRLVNNGSPKIVRISNLKKVLDDFSHRVPMYWGQESDKVKIKVHDYLPWPVDGKPVDSVLHPVTVGPYLDGYWTRTDVIGKFNYHQGWRVHTCTFIHELFSLPEHIAQLADSSNVDVYPNSNHSREAARKWRHLMKVSRAILGYTWGEIKDFATYEGAPPKAGWELKRQALEVLMLKVCEHCPHDKWARQLLLNMNEAEWSRHLNDPLPDDEGMSTLVIPAVNTQDWTPFVTPGKEFLKLKTGLTAQSWHKKQIENCREALTYYDEHYSNSR